MDISAEDYVVIRHGSVQVFNSEGQRQFETCSYYMAYLTPYKLYLQARFPLTKATLALSIKRHYLSLRNTTRI